MTAPSVCPITQFAERVTASIETVIVGKRPQIESLLVALLCRGHVLIEDVPGTGKTMLARSAAGSMDLSFNRVQCTPDLLPNDITGLSLYNQQTGAFEYRPGPILVNIVLVDEINRATPRTQSALLEAMAEHQVTVDGITHPLPEPFLVLATQNPIEYEGTFPLPEAQLDRFLLRMPLGYPQPDEEIQILRSLRKRHPIEAIHPVVDGHDLLALTELVTDVHVDPSLEQYIVAIVGATRAHPDLAIGASPRGSLALYKTGQVLAAIRGRDYVIPDDIKEMALLTLPHRLMVRPESQLRGKTPLSVLNEILEGLTVDIGEIA